MKTSTSIFALFLVFSIQKMTAQLTVSPSCQLFNMPIELKLDDPAGLFNPGSGYCVQFKLTTPPFSVFQTVNPAYATSTTQIVIPFLNGLTLSDYEVIVRDTLGCSSTVLTSCSCFSVGNTSVSGLAILTNPSCTSDKDGKIEVFMNGGCPPYSATGNLFLTFDGKVGTATGLPAGNYQFTITDQSGNQTGGFNETLTEPPPLSIVLNSSSIATCDTTGSLTVSGAGGTPPYTFTPGGQTTLQTSILGLNPGPQVVSMTDSKGCPAVIGTYLIDGDLVQPEGFLAPPNTDAIACDTLMVRLVGSSPTVGAQFSWLKNGVLIPDSIGTSIWVDEPGNYSLLIKNPANGCTATTAPVLIKNGKEFPAIQISPIGVVEICGGDSIALNAGCPANGQFCADLWAWTGPQSFADSSSKVIIASKAGDYSVTATRSSSGCTATATQTVGIKPTPNLTIPIPETTLLSGTAPDFDWAVSPAGAVIGWDAVLKNISPIPVSGTGLPGIQSFDLINKNLTGAAVFSITTELNGCIGASDTAFFKILPAELEVYAPEIISPNGNSANQTWQLSYPDYLLPDEFEMYIFNRSGGRIVGPQPLDFIWEANGCPNGTYFYLIKKKDGSGKQFKGAVTVIGK